MKKIKLFLILALLPALLAAGGTKEDGLKHVIIWHSSPAGVLNLFNEIIEEFNETAGKENGIEVEAIYQGKANDVLTKVNAAMDTDSLPDIAMMDATAALDMNRSPKTVTLEKLGMDTSSILPAALSSYTSERGTIALPFNASVLLYYYNRTEFDRNGVSVPDTIDEMTSSAPLLGKKDKEGNLTVSAFSGLPATYELSYFISQEDGATYLVNNRNGHMGGADRVLFGEEGTYRAFLEKWGALYATGFYNPVSHGVTDDFLAERCMSMLASSSNLSRILSSAGDSFEVGVAPVPLVGSCHARKAIVSGGALFTFTDSSEVKTVLEYLVSPAVQSRWSEGTGYLPVNTETYSEDEYIQFLDDNPAFRTALECLLTSDEDAVNVWLPSAYTIYYSFQKNIAEYLESGQLDRAVNEMVKTVQDAIDTYRAQN